MKRKNKNAFPRKRKEFRFKNVDVKKGKKITKMRHPTFVIIKKGNTFVYVTLTHSSNIKEKVVIKLRKNPNPKDDRDAYYVAEINEDLIDKFGKKIEGWELDENDEIDIRNLNNIKNGSAK